MGTKKEVSPEIQQLKLEFDTWRQESRAAGGKRRIPDGLWIRAAEVAKKNNVWQVCQACHLESVGLKKRMELEGPTGGFLELAWPAGRETGGELVAEISCRGRTVRIFSGMARIMEGERLLKILVEAL
jgi:hypothetical protein